MRMVLVAAVGVAAVVVPVFVVAAMMCHCLVVMMMFRLVRILALHWVHYVV
jgi:hypothetical protein